MQRPTRPIPRDYFGRAFEVGDIILMPEVMGSRIALGKREVVELRDTYIKVRFPYDYLLTDNRRIGRLKNFQNCIIVKSAHMEAWRGF
jgi:hypothetical protein